MFEIAENGPSKFAGTHRFLSPNLGRSRRNIRFLALRLALLLVVMLLRRFGLLEHVPNIREVLLELTKCSSPVLLRDVLLDVFHGVFNLVLLGVERRYVALELQDTLIALKRARIRVIAAFSTIHGVRVARGTRRRRFQVFVPVASSSRVVRPVRMSSRVLLPVASGSSVLAARRIGSAARR